ncbi:hypothetical protein PFICI_02673 [Pestalotiopsis fici W106-1]|uniref:Uncharacterized protein n=1 Tax=Pestalotiopsis fici (strain W106-1 / CGMCC3.15140) TaxID=1229662 RepID=W3XEX1_PESFW|nr:uncharacterized protein PFICI_02673 [Pestalotiopsis fici W106-1]ETS84648.1 hypothetical protein PFICI_02673 [Pestalotiopsis fici W106-1]
MAMPRAKPDTFMVKYVYPCGEENLTEFRLSLLPFIKAVMNVEEPMRLKPTLTIYFSRSLQHCNRCSDSIPDSESETEKEPKPTIFYDFDCGHDWTQALTRETLTILENRGVIRTGNRTAYLRVRASHCRDCRNRAFDALFSDLYTIAAPNGAPPPTNIREVLLDQLRQLHEAYTIDVLTPNMYKQLLGLVAQAFVDHLGDQSMASWLGNEPFNAFFVDDLRKRIREERYEASSRR